MSSHFIHMHILMKTITFTHILIHFSYLLVITCFFFLSYFNIFRVLLYCTYYSCNYRLSSHSSAILLISLYKFPLRILFIFFYVHACTYRRSRYGKNCMYPKVLSLYETVISICMYPKVLSLYETMISV